MRNKLVIAMTKITLLSLFCSAVYASGGKFFNITSTGLQLTINTTVPNHNYPAAGIKINTPGHTLSNPADCTMNSNGYCLFSVSDKVAKTISIGGLGGPFSITLCLNGAGALTCQTYDVALPGLAYIANKHPADSNIAICAVGANGSLSNCKTESDASISWPQDIVLNSSASLAYVLNFGTQSVSVCSLDVNGSLVTPCAVTPSLGADFVYGGINPSHTHLYLTSYNNSLLAICTLNPDGSIQTPCATSTGNRTFNGPNGRVAFHPAGTHLYVPNYINNTVSVCPVLQDGSLDTCVAHTDPTFNKPLGATLNPDGTVFYMGNQGNTVSICPINSDGSLAPCTSSTGNSTFYFGYPEDYSTNLFVGSNQYAYIPNVGAPNTISICPIIGNGLFGTCTAATDPTFTSVVSAWLSFG